MEKKKNVKEGINSKQMHVDDRLGHTNGGTFAGLQVEGGGCEEEIYKDSDFGGVGSERPNSSSV